MNKPTNLTQYRLRLIIFLSGLMFAILLVRLFYWQIIRGPELGLKAQKQHQQVSTLEAKRGVIYDQSGDIIAGTRNLFHLFVYKPNVEVSLSELAKSINHTLPDLSYEYLTGRLSLDTNWISIKHFLSSDQKQSLEQLNLKGVGFEDEYQRFYPEASLSAQVLGFVGSDSVGNEQGYFGLEGYFDRQLRGKSGRVKTEKDAHGQSILIGNYQLLKSIEGRSITTTIDKKTQFLVESELLSGIDKYKAKAGNAILIETKTGKVRAMASFPNYDPSHFSDFDSRLFRNPNVADLFEPGSIFKVVVMAAAIDANAVKPETICDICSGPIVMGEYNIKTWNDKYYPNTNMTDVIVHSDNTGMVFAARNLGKDRFVDYLSKFGFGDKTGIEQQEEVSGKLPASSGLRDIDLATNSFGQGIAVTPIQIAAAVNAIANQGNYIKPSLVEAIDRVPSSLPQLRRVVSPETASTVSQMMTEAVDRGEAKWAKPKGISVAGKTGTAQIPIAGHYDPEKTIASFVGFFPKNDPKYTLFVSLNEPKTSPWGSETAAPLWFSIVKQLVL